MKEQILNFCNSLVPTLDKIPANRKALLDPIVEVLADKKAKNQSVNLLFVCTHNSRRSIFGEVWANVMADFYSLSTFYSFSAGTEATAFNENAILSLTNTGFDIKAQSENSNPIQKVSFGDKSINVFSKTIDDASLPKENVIALMTCNEADQNCPAIIGAEHRFALSYDDPKKFDGSIYQNRKYDERSKQIATELMYVFSKL